MILFSHRERIYLFMDSLEGNGKNAFLMYRMIPDQGK